MHPIPPGPVTGTAITEDRWPARWEWERWFPAADGEWGKRFWNETIRVTPHGEVRTPAGTA